MKSKVGYSRLSDSFKSGEEAARNTMEGLTNPKIALYFTSSKYIEEEAVKGYRSILPDVPLVGCTSSGAVITNDGIITGEDGFSASMIFDDEDMIIGVGGSAKQGDARETGKKIALQAIKNANTNLRPSYFYMVANPAEEESYVKGIQDVIGRVPFFGGSTADEAVEGEWRIFCNDEVYTEGCAVVFFYTNKKVVTEYTGAYNETNTYGVITKINGRTLQEINGKPALEEYAKWKGMTTDELQGMNLLSASILNPLGVKDPTGRLTLVRHPMVGNEDLSMNIGNDLAVGTCVNMLSATVDELIGSTKDVASTVKSKLNNNAAGYFFVHCGGRKLGIGDRIEEVYTNLKEVCGDIPFITIFTFGEYGYNEHSSNSCGGLMLSFTGFGK